ncbi:hypothetical protein SLEP1_g43233 [Rubroshorea leprosula]|uniref:BTB domain-containing protein n=1 Tax=Rubroshorea leprosula TaxID=152421 RepID=A0AAV5LDA9_9ROSI|nr:hypothetical protein SLEP1_g43233 [Rubroshorea leprosula]
MLSGPTMLSEQSLPTALQLKIYSQLTFFIEGDDVDFRQVDVIACDLYARTSRYFFSLFIDQSKGS